MSAPFRINKLNPKQIQLLKIIYKFRFTTSSLIAQYRHTDKDSLNRTLQRLVDQKYLNKQYDNSFRIDRKGARFSLASAGITWLKNNSDLNIKTLHAMYNPRDESFIERCLVIMQSVINLKEAYPNTFDIYTTNEIAADNEFPNPRPELYLNRVEPLSDQTNEYFLEMHHDNQTYLIRKRFQALVEHFDEEGWPDGDYPTLLFVFATSRQESAFLHYAQDLFDSTGIDELKLLTTTVIALLSRPAIAPIWTSVHEPKKLVNL